LDAFTAWLHATALSQTIQAVRWIVPLVQSIHIVMIGIVFVSSLMVCLRVLGRAGTDLSFDEVQRRFMPWIRGALAVLLATGIVLIIGEPAREFGATSFWLKMLLVVIAGGLNLSLARAPATSSARGRAIALVIVWVAIVFLGRAIAYDVEVWQSLALHG
jgi:hypothetical protein